MATEEKKEVAKKKVYYVKNNHLVIESVQYQIGESVELTPLEAKAIGGEYLTTKKPGEEKGETEIE